MTDKSRDFYQQISTGLKKLPHKEHKKWAAYCGTKKIYYNLKNQVKRDFIKSWYKKHKKELSFTDFISLLKLLYKSNVYEEVIAASELLGLNRQFRERINPLLIDQWLDNLSGWAEVDSLCQSKFSPEEILADWANWQKLFFKLANSANPNKKRASLVLLTQPVRQNNDSRLKELSFKLIDKHKHHKDILITKAISWLLREMINNYRQDVIDYLAKNADSLPKIALRETKRKLLTGRK